MIPSLTHFSSTAPPSWLLLAIVLACALGGLPHGAMDGWIGSWWLKPRLGRWWWIPFGLGYLSLSALVIAAWSAFPNPSLLAFLTISFFHFSCNSAEAPHPPQPWNHGQGLWRGACVILGPALLHPAATGQHFSALTQDPTWPGKLIQARPWLLAAAGLCALLLLKSLASAPWRDRSFQRAHGLALLLTLSAVVLPPLLSFTLYFCCFHSPAHSSETWSEARARLTPAALSHTRHTLIALTILSVIFLLAGYLLLPATLAANTRLLLTLFVGLAALTVPHMLLQSIWEKVRQPLDPGPRLQMPP
jgi:beta-carotene 15,15'-dioxygenase